MTETAIAIEGSGVYRRSADVVCRQVGGESILVPIRQNVGHLDFVYTLSPVAGRIWALLDGTRSVDQILDIMCEEYEVGRDTATADLNELLGDLTGAGLVARVS